MGEGRVRQMLECGMMSDEEEELDKSSDAMKKLAIGVMEIVGIKTFSFQKYQLQVVKVPLFDWDEIEPQIIGFIQTFGQELLGEEVEHVEKPIEKFQYDGTKDRLESSLFEELES
jgi:hypothetical protein